MCCADASSVSASEAMSPIHMDESASEHGCDEQQMDDSASQEECSSMDVDFSACSSCHSDSNADSHPLPSGMKLGRCRRELTHCQ